MGYPPREGHKAMYHVGITRVCNVYAKCMNTPQARAQQHLFFAERAYSNLTQSPKHVTPPKTADFLL